MLSITRGWAGNSQNVPHTSPILYNPPRRPHPFSASQTELNGAPLYKKSNPYFPNPCFGPILVCCIFHKSRQVGESSDEEDSDSDSSSDSNASDDAGDGGAMMAGKGKGENRRQHEHQHGDGEGNCEGHAGEGEGNGKGRARRKGRNAYEKAPKSGSGGEVKK